MIYTKRSDAKLGNCKFYYPNKECGRGHKTPTRRTSTSKCVACEREISLSSRINRQNQIKKTLDLKYDFYDDFDLPNSRKDASVLGSRFYFTQRHCKNGHTSKRYTVSTMCQECSIINNKLWLKNPDKKKKSADNKKKWVNNNKEKNLIYQKEWRKNNKAKVNEYYSKWYSKEHNRESCYQKRLNRLYDIDKRTIKKYLPEIYSIYRECKRRRWLGEDIHVDHIVPLKGENVSGLHVPWNMRIISAEENRKKSNKLDQSLALEMEVNIWAAT
jgi:hypothetical protein